MAANRKVTGVKRALEVDRLKEENASLRARLGLDGPRENDWESSGTQEMRDRMAARALVAEWLDENKALIRLGFRVSEGNTKEDVTERRALKQRVFKTPGVEEYLHQNLADIEGQQGKILARLNEISQFGNDDAAVRAAQSLIKVLGLQKTPDNYTDNRKMITLYNMVNPELQGKEEAKALPDTTVANPLAFLDHEPGEPIPVTVPQEQA